MNKQQYPNSPPPGRRKIEIVLKYKKMNIENIKSVFISSVPAASVWRALIRYFLSKGKLVAGYDRTPSELTEHLIAEGAQIHYEENVSLIPEDCKDKETTLVVYTPAVPQDHAELVYFRNNGFEIQKRAQVLGTITHSSKGLCVAERMVKPLPAQWPHICFISHM